MELKDLIISPIVLVFVLVIAFVIRKQTADEVTRKYFFPGLVLKIFGAIGVGLVYQFYYGGGDTFSYFTHGSAHIWDAFTHDFNVGFKLLTANGEYDPETYRFASKIWMYRDAQSYFIVRIAAVLGLLTFSTYSSVAILFAFISFLGLWAMFKAFYRIYPEIHLQLAIGIFFIPTVFFWGSGILKDTVTLGAAGFLVYSFVNIVFERRRLLLSCIMLLLSVWVIYEVKLYILLCLLPSLIFWFFIYKIGQVPSVVARVLIAPFLLSIGLGLGYFVALKAGEDSNRYSIDNIAKTAQVTAYDIRFWTGKDAGSGYYLGELDGSFGSMLKLAPQAVNVSLFRPYIWEVNNPLMLLSALEAIGLLLLTLWVFLRNPFKLAVASLSKPSVLFCLSFSLVFAFGVGVSTYNFGTLSRYRIVLVPFYVIALFLIDFYAREAKSTEIIEA